MESLLEGSLHECSGIERQGKEFNGRPADDPAGMSERLD